MQRQFFVVLKKCDGAKTVKRKRSSSRTYKRANIQSRDRAYPDKLVQVVSLLTEGSIIDSDLNSIMAVWHCSCLC